MREDVISVVAYITPSRHTSILDRIAVKNADGLVSHIPIIRDTPSRRLIQRPRVYSSALNIGPCVREDIVVSARADLSVSHVRIISCGINVRPLRRSVRRLP